MLRSPIFVLLFLTAFISCNKKSKNTSNKLTKTTIQQADKLSHLGDLLYNNKKFDSAFYYYNNAKNIYEIEKDSSYIAYNSIQMARIQQTFGDYFGSEQTLTETLQYIKNNEQYQAAAYNLFGISSKELSNNEDAIRNYNKVFELSKDSLSKVTPINNIAIVYINQKKYNKAITILNSISKLNSLNTTLNKKALVFDNLGYAYFKANQISKGLNLMNEALNIRKNNNDSYGSIESYLHLSEFYQNANPQKSQEFALQGYQAATTNNSIDERLESLLFLIKNPLVETKKYTIKYALLNDSITKVRNRSKNQFAKIKYDSRKANEENLKLKYQNIESDLKLETQNHFTVFGIIVFIIGVGYLVTYFRNKNKREQIEATYITEIRLSKKLHDELANDVYRIMAFTEKLELDNPQKKVTLLDDLDKVYNNARDFSKQNSEVDTGENYEERLKLMIDDFSDKTRQIIINNNKDIDWSKIQHEKKIALYRILQELMVNMKKHSQCNFVVIGFENQKNTIQISYSDDGIGFEDQSKLKNGLVNVENRIHTINGSITFDSETKKGFRAKITFPK
jgi:signal transduction histidine kinase